MKDKEHINRINTQADLACLYNPHLTRRQAAKVLKSWIEYNPELLEKLKVYGYRKESRNLTPRQVEILMDFLGEP